MGRSPGERNDYPLQYSGLKNSMDFIVCGVAESDTTEQFSLSLSLVAVKNLLAKAGDAGLIPGKSYGQRSLVGYSTVHEVTRVGHDLAAKKQLSN